MADSLRQYGVAVMPLGTLVQNFTLEQGNFNQALFLKNLKHAEWAWKDVFRNVLWEIKTVPMTMDCNNTITLPEDCEQLINISVVDVFGRLHPLTCDSDLNTAKTSCVNVPCSCKKCHGENTLCGALDNITMTTETLNIKGTDYTKTTWKRYNGCGDIEEVTSTPYYDAATSTVKFLEARRIICSVETDSNGCIKATQPNVAILTSYLGTTTVEGQALIGFLGWNAPNVYSELIPSTYNFWGYYNYNAADSSIVHIFRNDYKPTLLPAQTGSTETWEEREWNSTGTLLITYRTNGVKVGVEILVPEYAYDAMVTGILYRQRLLNPRDMDRDKVGFETFRREKNRVFRYLNPVRMDLIQKLRTRPRKW